MKQNVRKAIEDTIHNRMNGICEGALWIEHNGYGPYIGHYNDPFETVSVLEEKCYTTELEAKTTVDIYLVPKGEGYKNFNNTFASYDDWISLVISYDWVLAYSVTLEP